uniref:Uncharacterized protein n=1 Tax=Anguilla anguilla TaxID=7936 RepID=A0A0E9VVF1_ANGAN
MGYQHPTHIFIRNHLHLSRYVQYLIFFFNLNRGVIYLQLIVIYIWGLACFTLPTENFC